ncbi:MAG: hypothetical protein H6623_02940 [Bdellovibrionaceae bacterium]|nr:hypothetical protein [Pseudobdellovibrionaceae bacterium]
MTTCPNCSEVFMVNIEGTVEPLSEDPPPEEYLGDDVGAAPFPQSDDLLSQNELEENNLQGDEEMHAEFSEADSLLHTSDDGEQDFSSVGLMEGEPETFDNAMSAYGVGDQNQQQSTEDFHETAAADQEPQDLEYSEDFLNALDGSGEDHQEATETESNPQDPLGVSQFDKTSASQLAEGPYYYDLIISGLDTADIKREVLKALDDKRFVWTLEDLKGKFHGGQLVLRNLNPVKAVLLMIKIQHIDVDIRWEQKPFTDPAVGSGSLGQV